MHCGVESGLLLLQIAVSEDLLCCHIAPRDHRGAKYSKMSGFSRLKDLLHAALVPRVEMSNVEEVQQHLRHIFILVDDILEKKKGACFL